MSCDAKYEAAHALLAEAFALLDPEEHLDLMQRIETELTDCGCDRREPHLSGLLAEVDL